MLNTTETTTSEQVYTNEHLAAIPSVTADKGYNFNDTLWSCSLGGTYTTAELAGYVAKEAVIFTAICAENGSATVVFDYDGGTDGTAVFKVITGTAETVEASGNIPNPVKVGFDFDSWTPATIVFGLEGSITTYNATFTPNRISIAFESGSNGMFTDETDANILQSIDAGTAVAGVPAITANSSYTFLGWTITGSDTKYSNADVAAMTLTVNTTFTAAYQQTTIDGGETTNYYTISFQENGGTAITPVSAVSGTTIDLGQYTTTRTGYSFMGWYSDELLAQPVSSVNLTNNMVVYAKWCFNGELNTADHFAYIVGHGDGTIRPNANISRAETATILYRLLTSNRRDAIFTTNNSFSDVPNDLWYNKAVSSMANGGYIQGYGDGTFVGNRNITRAEFMAMLVRFIGTIDGTARFVDVPTSHWAYKYIATATSAGWISGYTDGTFKPDQAITRAEAMIIMNRVLDRGVKADGLIAGVKQWPDNNKSAWYYYEVIEATNNHEHIGSRPSEQWTSLTTDYTYDISKYEKP